MFVISLLYRKLSGWLHRFRVVCFVDVRFLQLVGALTNWLDKFLFLLSPKINLASIIGRVLLVRSNNSQLHLIIPAIGGFSGLCVVMQ